MDTLILSKKEVRSLLDMDLALEAVREAYITFGNRQLVQPPIMSVAVPKDKGELDIKTCYSEPDDMISIKSASGYWDNKEKQLPTMLATVTLLDSRTGYPLCIMDGSLITGYRTGAAGGLSAQILSNETSQILAVIGAGTQARMQAEAICKVRSIKKIRVWSPSKDEMVLYKKDMEEKLKIAVEICKGRQEAVEGADIIVTVTPGREILVQDEWVKKGAHVIAVGADMEGKQELDPKLFKRSKVYNDSIEQCTLLGESRNAIVSDIIKKEDICGELSDVLLNKIKGRDTDEDITLFDTTGMGIQDTILAKALYLKAKELNLGMTLKLFEE